MPEIYTASAITFDRLDARIITDPVYPSNFYANLIKREWHKGKRPQQKPHSFDYASIGLDFEQVPYFEFDPTKPHITIYPLPVFEDGSSNLIRAFTKTNPPTSPEAARRLIREYPSLFKVRARLDLPVIIRSADSKQVNIMGAGYLTEDSAFYWPFSHHQYSLAKTALKERLGLEAQEYA